MSTKEREQSQQFLLNNTFNTSPYKFKFDEHGGQREMSIYKFLIYKKIRFVWNFKSLNK